MLSKDSLARYAVIPLFILALLNEISYQMVIPALNVLLKAMLIHPTALMVDTMYGMGIAAFTVAMIVGSPIMGWLSDKFGRKKVLLFCLGGVLGSSTLFITSLYLHNISLFILARILSGVAAASTAIVQAAVADISFARSRAVHFSTVGLALTLGLILGPLLGGYFIRGFDVNLVELSLPFLITGIIAVINIMLLAVLYHEIPHKKSDHIAVYSMKYLTKYLGLFFILEFSWSLYYLSLPTYLTQRFLYDSYEISLYLSSLGVSMCFGLIFYRWISQYLSNQKIVQISFGIFIVSLFLPMWWMIVPITWSVALSYVALMGLLSDEVGHKHQGILMGTTLTTMALAWTVTGFAVKFLATMNVLYPFMVSGVVLAVGLCLAL
ncbi:MAG TPA: MFS transporter [Gammaproteobacteria bacterium]|nr:MFS transporter [Gammaproteobacteria bacterium]